MERNISGCPSLPDFLHALSEADVDIAKLPTRRLKGIDVLTRA